MLVGGLRIPTLLLDLLAVGAWPTNSQEAMAQNVTPMVTSDRIRAIAPGQNWLYLLAPPFRTVSQRVGAGEEFWNMDWVAPAEIDFEKTIVIGDFGPGSDAPILLDYSIDIEQPEVRRLDVSASPNPEPEGTRFILHGHWVSVASSFEEFAYQLGFHRGGSSANA